MDVALSEPFRNGEGNVPAETIPAEVRARPPGVPAGALVRKRISAQTRTARARAMTAATARHADARLTPSPAKVATCLGTSHASGSPTRPEDDSSSPASPDTPEAFPRARANPADAPGASAAPEDAERLFLPGEARNGSRSSRASAGSDAKRHPSFKKTHWVKDKDAKACGHEPCSRPFTVLLRRHHCRACGLVFCARCVETRLLLDPQTAEPVTSRVAAAAETAPGVAARVCVRCYERAFEAAKAAAKREGTHEGTRVASVASEASEASSSSHVEEHRNTAFSVSETTSFGSAETRAREGVSLGAFFPKKASDAERKETRVSSKAESSEASDASKESLGGAVTSSGRSVTLRRNPPTAFLSARTRIEALAEERTATPAREEQTRQTDDSYDDDDDDDEARGVAEDFDAPRAPFASPLETAEGRRVRRETAALLEAVTPVLAEASSRGLSEPPEPLSGDDGDVFAGESDSPNDAAAPRRLVARFARQLREQARLTEDAAAAAREARRRAAATEEELALARAQVRRMGALWEELTQARRELESARETRNVSDRVPSRDGCTSSSLLATFETKFSNSGERTSTPSDGERESGWSECVVWHGERGEASRNGEGKKEKSPSFGGLSFQDCVTGTTRRVRHGDVAAVRVAFDARSGASVLAVTIKEDTDAFAALGACVRCRVDGAVTANRWALEIQKRVDEHAERDGRA